ncbi:MAG TPA: peptidase S41 [Porphyromonadaceae bacterium]|nr:peptidase S41 [Porphyromonadaceae bacterium]
MRRSFFTLLLCSFTLLARGNDYEFEQKQYLEIFTNVCRELSIYYVDTIHPEKMIRTGIGAMLNTLDPYTNYIPEENMEDFELMTTGEYGGIGALISKREEGVYISEIYEGTPSMKAGLLPGDIFLRIDSVDVTKKNQSEVSKLLRGGNNTLISVEVKREGTEGTIKKQFQRKKVSLPSVPYYGIVGDNIGYIKLTSFTEKSAEEVRSAFSTLKKRDSIKGLILDLRDNPGGVVESAVRIVSLFVPKGSPVLSMRGKVQQFDKTYTTNQEPMDDKIPLAVLINEESASASEIVAGAVQDLDRGVLFGTHSFGKGLVQISRPLPYNGVLKLTSAKYYIPSGRCIQAIDYFHKKTDGSVENVPDSLIHEFKTLKNGRIVKDGRGLLPDVEVKEREVPDIVYQLARENIIFDYATQYYFKHKTIPSPSKFSLSEEEYREFKQFVKSKKFSYKRRSEDLLDKIQEIMKMEKVSKTTDSVFVELKKSLKMDIDRDLETFKKDIKFGIEMAICTRYYYTAGVIEHNLRSDEQLQKVLHMIKYPESFLHILSKDYKPNNVEKK